MADPQAHQLQEQPWTQDRVASHGAPNGPPQITSTVQVFDPKGAVRSIPMDKTMDALGSGGRLAVQVRDPQGFVRYVPEDQVDAALHAGGTALNRTDMEAIRSKFRDQTAMKMLMSSTGAPDDLAKINAAVYPQDPQGFPQDTGAERFAHSAGFPAHVREVMPMIHNILQPEMSPTDPAFGQTIPIIGPAFRAQRETFDQPGPAGKIYGSIPLLGPPGYRAGQQFESGDISGGFGSLANIVTQVLGMRGALRGKPNGPLLPSAAPGEAALPGSVSFMGRGMESRPGLPVMGAPVSKLGDYFAKTFGLSSDYGQRVADRVNQIHLTREATQQDISGALSRASATRHAITAQQDATIGALESQLQRQINDIQQGVASRVSAITEDAGKQLTLAQEGVTRSQAQIQQTGRRILADTTRAVFEDHARAQKPFLDIGAKMKEPVTDGATVRDIVEEEARRLNVRPEEIPPAAYKALGPEGKVQLGGAAGGMRPEQIPASIRAVMTPEELGQTPVSFNTMTRIRDDLYGAADASKDGAVQAVLRSAGDRLSQMQEEAADKAGLGDAYRKAKQGWMEFKRGAGSPMMENWLSAKDVEEQAIAPKLARLTSRTSAEALRTTLKYLGVDVSPLDEAISGMKAAQQRLKDIPKDTKTAVTDQQLYGKQRMSEVRKGIAGDIAEVRSQGKSALSDIDTTAGQHIRDLTKGAARSIREQQASGEILPRRTAEDLEGMTPEQINRLMIHMRANGVGNPAGLMMTMYGLSKVLAGNMHGMINLGYGVTKLAGKDLVTSPRFQNYVLRQAGIIPNASNLAKIQRALADIALTAKPVSKASRSEIMTRRTASDWQQAVQMFQGGSQ